MAFNLPRKKSKSSQSDDGSASTPAKPRKEDLLYFAKTGVFPGMEDFKIVQQDQTLPVQVKTLYGNVSQASDDTSLELNREIQSFGLEVAQTTSSSKVEIKDKILSLLKNWTQVSVKFEYGKCYFGVSYRVKHEYKWTNYCTPCYITDDKFLYSLMLHDNRILTASINKGKLTIGYYDQDHDDYGKVDRSKAFVPVLIEVVDNPEMYASKIKEQQSYRRKQSRSSDDEVHQDEDKVLNDEASGWWDTDTGEAIVEAGVTDLPSLLREHVEVESQMSDEFEMVKSNDNTKVIERKPTRVESKGIELKGQMEVLHDVTGSKVLQVKVKKQDKHKKSLMERLTGTGAKGSVGKMKR